MLNSRLHFLGLLFFGLSWLSYDHYRPWVNFHAEALAIIGLTAFAFGLLFRLTTTLNMPTLVKRIALVALIPWVQYSLGISLFAGDALICSIYVAALAAAVWVGFAMAQVQNGTERNGPAGLMHSFWIVAMISAAIGMAHWFNIEEPLGMYVVQGQIGQRAMGNLGQANQLATLLLMGLIAFAWAYERFFVGPITLTIGSSFLTIALVMAHSRAGILGAFLVVSFIIWKKRRFPTRLQTIALVIWLLLYIGGTLILPFASHALLISEDLSISRPQEIGYRVTMWKQVAYAITQAPWVGYGWNQTPTAHAAGAIAFPFSVTYTNAHNFILDILAWNGIPIGLLILGAIGWWFLSRMRSVSTRNSIFGMAALLPFAMHSMVEYPFAYAYFLIAAGFMVGFVEAERGKFKVVTLNLRWVLPLVFVWTGIGSYLIYEYLLIEEDFRVVRFENLKLGNTPPEYEVPKVRMLSQMSTMLNASRLRANTGMSLADLETLRKASARFSYGALRFRYAQALALNGNPLGALSQLEIIKGMYGVEYYDACIIELKRLSEHKYPQLAAVI